MLYADAVKRMILWFIVLLAALFACRMWYGYRTTPDEPITIGSKSRVPSFSFKDVDMRRGVATIRSGEDVRKVDITAEIVTASRAYDSELRGLREAIGAFGGEIRFMQDVRRSDVTTRAVAIAAVVPSRDLDRFYDKARTIGRLESASVTRTDLTEEYRKAADEREELNAARRELAESRRARLSSKELADVQDRLLEVGHRIRELMTRLAPYEDASLANVHMIIYEDREVTVAPPSAERRAMVAFKWAVKYGLALTGSLAFFAAFIFLLAAMFGRVADIVAPRGRHARSYDGGRAVVVPASKRLNAPEGEVRLVESVDSARPGAAASEHVVTVEVKETEGGEPGEETKTEA